MRHLTVIRLLGLCFAEAKNSVTVNFPPRTQSGTLQSRLRPPPAVVIGGTICSCCLKVLVSTPLFNVFGSKRTLRKRWRYRKGDTKNKGSDDLYRIIATWQQMRKGLSALSNGQSIDCVLRTRGGWQEEMKSGAGNEERSRGVSTGDTPLEHGELGGCEKAPQRTAAASGTSVVVPRPEKLHVDAKEEKMRAALLAAEGPNKILREVERIPALRRLSDSALRITSAKASDGRLAALALYRLGASARAAETAVSRPLPSPEVTGSAAEAKMGPAQRVGASPPSSVDSPSPVIAAAESTRPALASKEKLESDIDDKISLESRREAGMEMVTDEGSSDIERPSTATCPRDAEGEGAGNMGQSGDALRRDNVLQRPGEAKEENATGSETETVQQGRDAGDGGVELDSSASASASHPSPSPAAAAAAATTFDVESVKRDQRFEQLVEIVECVASGLSVSDISKVVWGLSILGHLPRNSLLESLANILADRLRKECRWWTVPEATTGASAVEEKDKEIEEGSALGVDETQSTLSLAGRTSTRSSNSTGVTAAVAGVAEAAETGDSNAELVKVGGGGSGSLGETGDSVLKDRGAEANPSAVSGEREVSAASGDAGGDAGGASEGEATKPVLVTSGTDLATAALSFAYAHARLDVSTGELLDVLAACVVPQLASMPLRDLANLAWAFAMQRHPHRQLLEGIAREVTSGRIDGGSGKMTAKEVSILAWSYGALGLRPAGLFRVLAREGLATVHEATAHDLSNLAWGLARVGVLVAEEENEEDRANNAPGGGERIESSSSAGGLSGCRAPTKKDDDCSSRGGDDTRPPMLGEHENDGLLDCSGDDGSLEGGVSGGVGSAWGFGWVLGKKWMTGRQSHETGARHKQMKSRRDAAVIQGMKEKIDEGFDADMEARCGEGRREVECDSGLDEKMELDERDVVGAGLVASLEGIQVVEPPLGQRLGEAVLDRASDCFRQFLPKQLSRLCWALGSWHSQGVVLSGAGPFAARALTEAGHRPKDYTAEELAQVLWAFATLVGNADSPAQELAGLLGALAEGFKSEVAGGVGGSGIDPVTTCDVLWSFAKLGYPAHSLCEVMARDLVDQVQRLPPSSVARLAWAYAKMGHPSAELMERTLSVVERRLNDFSVEDATSALWALGALGYTVSLKRRFDFSREDLRSLNPSATANLLWGLAKTGAAFADGFDREALQAVAADMGPKLLSFSPRELCRTAWALGRLGLEGVFFGSGTGDVDEAGGNGAVPEGDIGGSVDEMPRLMDKLLGECSKWLELFTPQELETLLWTLCRLEHRADDFVSDMAVEAKRRQDGLSDLQLQLGPSAVRDAAFHLGCFRHLVDKYRGIDFDGQRARGRYRRGKSMLSRMFRER